LKGITKVVIERAEGMTGDPTMQRRTFEGTHAEQDANAWLYRISTTAPRNGDYDKTDVWITLSDGVKEYEYEARFDVKHYSCPDPDLNVRQHLTTTLTYYTAPETLPHIAKDARRLQYARESTTDEVRAGAQQLLDILNGKVPQ
jgi:hypothetical protein